MVVHGEVQGAAGQGHLAGYLHVGLRRRRIAGGVVVHQDHRRGGELQRPAGHLARIDRRMIDGALVHHLVTDQLVLLVEEQHPELFARLVRQRQLDVGEQRAPGADHRALLHRLQAHALGKLMHQLKIERRLRPDPAHGAEVVDRGGEHPRQGPEPRQQVLGQRLDVAAGERAEKVELERLVVVQRLEACVQRPLAQPLAVAEVVGPGRLGRRDQSELPLRFL